MFAAEEHELLAGFGRLRSITVVSASTGQGLSQGALLSLADTIEFRPKLFRSAFEAFGAPLCFCSPCSVLAQLAFRSHKT